MSSVAVMDDTRAKARDLEQREMRRGYKLPDARRRLALRLGAAPGTLRNLALGWLKKIDAAFRERVGALLVEELQKEIGRLSHDLETHIRAGARLDSGAIIEAQNHIKAVKTILSGGAP